MAAELVGGAFLNAIFEVLLDRLAPHVEFLNFIRGKKLDKNLLHRLKPSLVAARAVLNDAELKQIKDSAVKEWLDDLKDAVYDADDLVDEISTKAATQNRVHNFSFGCLNVNDREMGNKLQDLTDRLELIVNQKDVLGLKMSVPENLPWRPQSTSLVKVSDVYGREKEKMAIIEFMSDDNGKLCVIPVVGMGGIGKTTLVQLVYNDDHVKQKFDLRAWICVSEAFNLLKITHTIIKAVTPDYVCDIMDLNLLQLDLKERLLGKKFLVVLDDVWNENYTGWNTLMNPFHYGIEGSKILVTTRSERVASMVKTTPSFYRLGLLSDEDCLSLFARHAFHSADSTSNSCLAKIGRDTINKCKGLPLAAKALGGLFRSKPNIKYWNTILKNDMWDSTKNEIIPALRVSYHYLPPHLKQCFVYCSLFPEDYEIDKNDLILMWMAEGFLQPLKRGMTVEEVGCEYFDDLTSRSFIQPSSFKNGSFVMHDLIRELATSIAGEFYFKSEVEEGSKISSRTRHLSYNNLHYPKILDFDVFRRVRALRTFLGLGLESIPKTIENIPDILLSNLKYLRVLSLANFEALKTIPNSIGEFIHLRYLDLSDSGIVSLPDSLCKLYNLQTLKLCFCYELKMLPSGMEYLVNLRYLDATGTPLEEMPMGMGKLKDLQFLSDFVVGKKQGTMIGELGEIANLQKKLCLRNLENIRNGNEAYEARMKEKKNVKILKLSWLSDDCINDSQTERGILDKLKPHWNLKCLILVGYRGTIFPNWLGNCSYHNMTQMKLSYCRNCCMLPPLGQLPSLETLLIEGFDKLETIGGEFFKSDDSSLVTAFLSLKNLEFSDIPAWKKWHLNEMEAFPKLQELKIINCHNLIGDLPSQLLALKSLYIDGCPLLASSIPVVPAIQNLHILGSEGVALHELPLSLCHLNIAGCRQVEAMSNSIAHSKNSCLQYLILQDCYSAISLPVIRMPLSVKKLWIYNCKQLEFPKEQCHESLESLSIYNSCETLTSLPTKSFPNLKELYIYECENLSSMLASNTPLQNLQHITIHNCKNLKSLSDHADSLLPNLKKFRISKCSEIGAFQEGFLPPSLIELEISYGDKLFACHKKWHLTSLTCLRIFNIHDDSVNCFPAEGLLPATLRTLELSGFSSLETLDCEGLQHLTSLQELKIYYCLRLRKVVGEMLPVSLIKLQIERCDLLEEQCRMKDREIWPKISHITVIKLTHGLIT